MFQYSDFSLQKIKIVAPFCGKTRWLYELLHLHYVKLHFSNIFRNGIHVDIYQRDFQMT